MTGALILIHIKKESFLIKHNETFTVSSEEQFSTEFISLLCDKTNFNTA